MITHYFGDLPAVTAPVYVSEMSWRACFQRGEVWLVFLCLVLFTIPSVAESTEAKPLNCTQIMAWLTGGVSSHRLNQLVQGRNLAFPVDGAVANTLLTAGADLVLIQSLRTLPISSPGTSATVCPAALAQAGDLISHKHYDEAERILRNLVTADPGNPALHFAYGYL
ncbi:MAG: hypothetical protein DMG97_41660, partial [Acidobacteria bacterium]